MIPPILIDELDDKSLERLKFLKNKFYNLVKFCTENDNLKLYLIDGVGLFHDKRELFRDVEHPNAYGAMAFSEYINSLLR